MQQFLLLMDVLPWWMKKQVKSAMLVGYHWFMVGAERALYSDLGSDLLKTRIPVAYFKVGKRFLHLSKNPWMYACGHIWPHILRVKHSVCIVHLGTLGYVYRVYPSLSLVVLLSAAPCVTALPLAVCNIYTDCLFSMFLTFCITSLSSFFVWLKRERTNPCVMEFGIRPAKASYESSRGRWENKASTYFYLP